MPTPRRLSTWHRDGNGQPAGLSKARSELRPWAALPSRSTSAPALPVAGWPTTRASLARSSAAVNGPLGAVARMGGTTARSRRPVRWSSAAVLVDGHRAGEPAFTGGLSPAAAARPDEVALVEASVVAAVNLPRFPPIRRADDPFGTPLPGRIRAASLSPEDRQVLVNAAATLEHQRANAAALAASLPVRYS